MVFNKPCKYFDTEMILIAKMMTFLYDDLNESCGGLCRIVTDGNNIDDESLKFVIEESTREENKDRLDANVARYICESMLKITMDQRKFLFGIYKNRTFDDYIKELRFLNHNGCVNDKCDWEGCIYKYGLDAFPYVLSDIPFEYRANPSKFDIDLLCESYKRLREYGRNLSKDADGREEANDQTMDEKGSNNYTIKKMLNAIHEQCAKVNYNFTEDRDIQEEVRDQFEKIIRNYEGEWNNAHPDKQVNLQLIYNEAECDDQIVSAILDITGAGAEEFEKHYIECNEKYLPVDQ